ncbi:hypothetical protein ACOSQ2_005993 [Xanthoceras sorbifolium]
MQTEGICNTTECVVLERNVLLRLVTVTKALVVNIKVECACIYIGQVLCGQITNMQVVERNPSGTFKSGITWTLPPNFIINSDDFLIVVYLVLFIGHSLCFTAKAKGAHLKSGVH